MHARRSPKAHTISDSDFDIECDDDNMAFLIIDHEVCLFFATDEDLANFINATKELEIANDAFKSQTDNVTSIDKDKDTH